MSCIRLVKASAFYPGYMRGVYEKSRGLERASYAEQWQALMGGCFGWADSWKTHLESTGRFEVIEVVTNAEFLQKAWAREQGAKVSEERWRSEIVRAQARHYRPDVFFPHDYSNLDKTLWLALKQELPGLIVVGYDGLVLCDPARFEGCDLVLGCSEVITEVYARAGFDSHFFKLGFETSVLGKLRAGRDLYPVSFVGGISLGQKGHNRRLSFLESMIKEVPLDLFLEAPHLFGGLICVLHNLRRGQWSNAFRRAPRQILQLLELQRHNRGALYGLPMYQALADSGMTLNIHIDAAGSRAANMRLFEGTGVGTCLVTDWKENILEFFEPDREVVTFKSREECQEKIGYLLGNEGERRKIARAGQKRTLEYHTLKDSILQAGERIAGCLRRRGTLTPAAGAQPTGEASKAG